MSKMNEAFLLLLFAFSSKTFASDLNHYWKDYTGTIPEDAVVGGRDRGGQNVYIGQAFIQDTWSNISGIFVVEIYPGVASVSIPLNGVRKVTLGIKILCSSNQSELGWVRSSYNTFHLDMIDNHPVVGGLVEGRLLHVCKVYMQGEIKIGKISLISSTSQFICFFVDGQIQRQINSYEVLVFGQDNSKNVITC